MSLSKYKLRQHFLAQRKAINVHYREEAAYLAAKHFAHLDLFAKSQTIACYSPFKDEFNAMPLMETILNAKKNCYLPVLTQEKTLLFVRYQYGDPLHKNRYGIFEPKIARSADEIAADDLDIVVMPLLAFDKKGGRLGTGGGYYDRTFAFMKERLGHNSAQNHLMKPHLLGLAFANQASPEPLPEDPWDIAIEAVVTEKGIIQCA